MTPKAEMQAVNRTPVGQWSPQMGLTPEVKAFIDAQVAQGNVGYNGRFPINENWSVIAVPPGQEENGNFFPGAYTIIENGTDKNAWHPGIQAYEFNATTGAPNRTFGWSNPDRYTMGEKLAMGLVGGIAGGAALTGMGVLGGGAGAGAGTATTGASAAGGTGASQAATAAATQAAATGGAVDLGGGLMMAADGSIIGGTGAFVPATASEMAAMTGAGGLGSGAMGAAGAAGEFSPSGFDLPSHELTHSMGGLADFGDGVLIPSSMGGSGLTLSDAATAAGAASKVLGNGGAGAPGAFDWTSLIGPGLAAVGGIAGAKAAGDAADSQLQASRESNALLEKMFNKQIELQEPFRQGGIAGLNRLTELLGVAGNKDAPDYGSAAKSFGMSDFQADPGYAFQQAEGQKALERSAAARGGLFSGRAMKDTLRFSQGLASQEYGNAFNRFQTERAAKLNPLQSLAGVGQSSANTLTNAAGNYGNAASQNIADAGNARAAGIVGRTNAFNNALGTGYSMYQNQQQTNQNNALMNAIINRGF